jgi:hypothetical protein
MLELAVEAWDSLLSSQKTMVGSPQNQAVVGCIFAIADDVEKSPYFVSVKGF